MHLIVMGVGEGGSNVADEFAKMGEWAWINRRIRLFSGSGEDAINQGVFSINLGTGDLFKLKHIDDSVNHCIAIGSYGEFHGSGAGKDNMVGALQARDARDKILSTIRDHGRQASADAILVIASAAGGTGSGGVGVVVDMLKEEFLNKPVFAMLLLPFAAEYDDNISMLNTATCLDRVINCSQADGVILIDNQRYIRQNESHERNRDIINQRIVDTFLDLLCVGSETDPRFIGDVLDARDVINTFRRPNNVELFEHGPSAIGAAFATIPKRKSPGRRIADALPDGMRRGSDTGAKHFSSSKEDTTLAEGAINRAFGNLSIACSYVGGDADKKAIYDAYNVLALVGGPSKEVTTEIVEMVDKYLADHVPGAGRRVGTYPGRTSEQITITIILSGIGQGSINEKLDFFYVKGREAKEDVERRMHARAGLLRGTKALADGLPHLP